MMLSRMKSRIAVAGVVVVALLVVPAPLLPPHRLAEAVQSTLGVGWKAAYLVAAVVLQSCFYSSLGLLAALAINRSQTLRGRLLQVAVAPVVVVGVALVIRSVKVGHMPIWINAAVPIAACLLGVWLGLGLLYWRWKLTFPIVLVVIGGTLWGLMGGTSTELSRATKARLERLVAVGADIPPGDTRFGALLQKAFASTPADLTRGDAVQDNRSAILAWGVAVGHERLARLVGLDSDEDLVHRSAALGQGTTLRGREDWPRHFALSAALAVLEHPLVSDAGGLMKEQLDALTGGSGFSFGDLLADRAGVRFAAAATHSEAAAKAMRARLQQDFAVDDFFPAAHDLPENLTVEQFRRDYGGVGSQRYRRQVDSIETLLDRCAGLRQQ
jgi:hypothetical protein